MPVTIPYFILTFFRQATSLEDICKQCRPVQTPQHAASDQGLHYLLTEISMQNTIKG